MIQLECIIFRRKGKLYEFLLLKRIPEKGGFWQPPCGKLEKSDNSKLDAAYREVLEETGISKDNILRAIKNVHYFETDKHYITGKPIKPIKEYVFGFEVKPNVQVGIDNNINTEHEEYKWVSFDKALKLLKWENNKDAFKKLNAILSHQNK